MTAALDAVRRGEADHALVPIENSVEGSVAATLDELAAGDPLMVTREVLLPVSFALMARPGTALARRTSRGDPPACPRAVPALAADRAAGGDCACLRCRPPRRRPALADGTRQHDAALAAPIAAERYGWRCSPRTSRTTPTP